MVNLEIRRHTAESPWTYVMLDARQREIAARARAGGEGALLLSEVAPVITLGRRNDPGDLTVSEGWLLEKGIGVHRTDRGGLATWHGPGQWVLFVVDRLEALTGDRRGVRKAIHGLLEVAREVAGELGGSPAEIRDGCETGVWTTEGKFAAVGVHIEQGVLLHGLAINGFKAPTSFLGLRPCGLDAPVSYLLENPDQFEELASRIVGAALRRFW